MAKQFEIVTIDTLSGGAVIERLNLALEEVCESIDNPNTTPTAVRKVVMEIKFKPTIDRTTSAISVRVEAKTPPITELDTQVYMGKGVNGKFEISQAQEAPTLFDDMDVNGTKITPITAIKEGTNS